MIGKVFKLDNKDFAGLQRMIFERSGLHFPDEKKYVLENRLQQRLRALALERFSDYAKHLTRAGKSDPEWDRLLDLVTTRETYFFRDRVQLDWFNNHCLPRMKEKKKTWVRILSAACSSGEEAYTLAILLNEAFNGTTQMDWRIIGVDISPQAIADATRAVYGKYSVRYIPPTLRKKYFEESTEGLSPVRALRDRVSFRRMSLLDQGALVGLSKMDVIFCRNVLIYFDTVERVTILKNLGSILNEGGAIITGFSEMPKAQVDGLAAKHYGACAVYEKA